MTSIQNDLSEYGNKNKTVHLKQIFESMIENDDTKVTLENLSDIISKDLSLQLDHLNSSQLISLPYMLINYVKKWPGWDKQGEYENGLLDLESWYKRFRSYVLYKMSLLISKTIINVDNEVQKEIEENKKLEQVNSETQLSNRASFANFNIEIAGPASLFSNVVFWGVRESIVIEEHSARPWIALDCVQLLNYPFVEVEFNSPELSFKRSFEPRMSRYISGCADLIYEKPSFILGKHRINSSNSKFIFPTSLLDEYIKYYKEVMHSQLAEWQRTEVDVILNQFYKDIADISTSNNVTENRQVTFNIGKNIYKRSKKISNAPGEDSPDPIVIYNELFLPKITSSFRYFTGMQEFTLEGKRVVSTKANSTKNAMLNFKPMISYKCTYCKLGFAGPNGRSKILNHLESKHKREQPLLCLLCKNSFEVSDLAKQRWKCECQEG